MRFYSVPVLLVFLFLSLWSVAQDTDLSEKVLARPDKLFSALGKKSRSLESDLDKQTDRYLSRLQRQEEKLKKKLWKKDSLLAKELFSDIEEKYAALRKAPGTLSSASSVYNGHLDSLTTSLRFLQQGNLPLAGSPALANTLSQYKELQSRLNYSEQVKKYLVERRHLLTQKLSEAGLVKQLKDYQKTIYYYQVQVTELREAWIDPSKLEAKLLDYATRLPRFRQFFANNSVLGSLFALPDATTNPAALQGLQTRASVNQSLIDRFGSGSDATQLMQQGVQQAQGELNRLKQQVSSYSSADYGNGAADLPKGFKPNQARTKTLKDRLVLGTDVQSQKARNYFPVTTDLALSLGYQLNYKSIIGIGAAYKLGLGTGFNNISLSHQGVGLRSYIDYQLKGTLFISGGYEQNYRSAFRNIDQLKDYSSWQTSGLLGLNKKYKLRGKLKGEMKLLWDFLSAQQTPRTQAILFRIGYSLK
ncbi:MAG TPA: hypothetical protein VHK91_16810 [Flavisolibacter sp.]|jgi:hypothetical protein|nr:hypothetical protein [Flavisolibacter sp.]